MRNIIRAILASFKTMLKTTTRMVWNTSKRALEWTVERSQVVLEQTGQFADTVISAPMNFLRSLGSGPGKGGSKAEDERDNAAERHSADLQRSNDALQAGGKATRATVSSIHVKQAARMLQRGEQPNCVPETVVKWLQDMGEFNRKRLCTMSVDQVTALMKGDDVSGIKGFSEEEWALRAVRDDIIVQETVRRIEQATGRNSLQTAPSPADNIPVRAVAVKQVQPPAMSAEQFGAGVDERFNPFERRAANSQAYGR